jgi:predicted ATPase/DNA-binding SARP family transcriptional activator
MDARCRIEMLGELRVTQGDRAYTRFRTHKVAGLLAYLALNLRQTHARDHLIDIFWPDRELDAARNNLSTALSQLRPQLEPPGVPAGSILFADRQQVRLNPEAVSTDVQEFETLLHSAPLLPSESERLTRYEQALELYRGELLPGVYEDWALRERDRLQMAVVEAQRRLAKLWEAAGDAEKALSWVLRLIPHDPYEEEPYRDQMRLYGKLHRPAQAWEVYQAMEALFRKDLGISPSAETRLLAETFRHNPRTTGGTQPGKLPSKFPLPKPSSTKNVVPSLVPEVANLPMASAPPLQLTRFFGRTKELQDLKTALQAPGTRLVSILGTGGLGKTRLAIELAQQLFGDFGNRVWFVPLAGLPDASLILSAIMRILNLPPDRQGDPLDRIVAYLSGAPCLLILDNFEHLLQETIPSKGESLVSGGASGGSTVVVRLLLERLPELVCLVTSRQPLRMGGEQEYPLNPLELPNEAVVLTPEALLQNASIALYVDRAQAARPDFTLNTGNIGAISALCRHLEGLPLALEMAAAWIKTIPPARMLERLETQLDLLVSRRRDLPERHQSLRATIEWSYNLLASELRADFARLSVFRGGWSLEAAEAVCGSQVLHHLLALQEQSLVIEQTLETGDTRFRMLEPLREFALEKLRESGEAEDAQFQHLTFFLQRTHAAHSHYHTPAERELLESLEQEHDNLRAALQFSLRKDALLEVRSAGCDCAGKLWWFWLQHDHINEGRQWLYRAIEVEPRDNPLRLHAILLGAGLLAAEMADMVEARRLIEEATEAGNQTGSPAVIISTRNALAITAYDSGEVDFARECWEANVVMARQGQSDLSLGHALSNLGELEYDIGDIQRARELLQEALIVRRRMGVAMYLGRNLMLLAKVAITLNDIPEASRLLYEGISHLWESGIERRILEALEATAQLSILGNQPEHAAKLIGFANSNRERIGFPRMPNEQHVHETILHRLTVALTPVEQAELLAQGSAWSLEQAVQYARSILEPQLPLSA